MTTDIIVENTPSIDAPFPKDLRTSGVSDPIAFQNLEVVKKIGKGKYPVYLTSSKVNNQNYIMKMFTDVKGADEYYENEIRFATLDHPNIVKIVDYDNKKILSQKDRSIRTSYILSEYAPHGDFFDFVINHRTQMDDKLVRTYFRQLIEGLEYLHSLGVAHLDLKPENLLIGADFNLKIADFDLSYVTSDEEVLSRGSKNYRAPELYTSSSNVELDLPFAADIYSAGIILFILKCGGVFPHAENRVIDGMDFTEMMHKNHRKFWPVHCQIQGRSGSFFDNNFKDLFHKMVNASPKQRTSIKKIKESKWYNGPVYTPEELSIKMKTILDC